MGIEGVTPVDEATALHFGPYRLEGVKRLWHGDRLIEVRPRPLAVLRYLTERPGQLVTGEELLKQLWSGIYVTKTVLRVCVRELRQALDEDPVTPRFIETVGRQGYRFIAPLTTAPSVLSSQLSVVSSDKEEPKPPQLETLNLKLETPFVGRERELARLHELFERVQRGERQVLFLLGEPGIGKTTLIDRFLVQVRARGNVRIGRGQCIEHYGAGEAYLPLLDALGQLCKEPDGASVINVLHRSAPLWLDQLSGLLTASEREALQRQIQSSNRERMLRELIGAIETLSADTVLVLVLEDLQWSDASTLEVLAYLAQRQQRIQLYILATYRPTEVVVSEHPLRQVVQELHGRRQCEELALELFSEVEVEEYLRQRFGRSAALTELSRMIYQRTDGNALFMVSFVDALVQQELIAGTENQLEIRADLPTLQKLVPDNLQQTILRQIERLQMDEQQLLGVASVGGRTFTAMEIAESIGRPLEDVEEVCDELAARERLIAAAGIMEWPDGAVTARYEFRHALYQQVVYEQVGQARRIRLHRYIGKRKEAEYGDRTAEIAAGLAVHFTEGRDYERAVKYYCQAGETALRRGAYRETIAHCEKGLELLKRLPDTPERPRQELALLTTLGITLIMSKGYAAPEVEQTFLRARSVCEQVGELSQLFSVLYGLWNCYAARGDLQTAYELAEQLLDIARRADDSALQLIAHWATGLIHSWYGHLIPAREHLEQVLAHYDPLQHGPLVFRYGQDFKVTALSFGVMVLWLLGYPDQACRKSEEALAFSQELVVPFNVAYAFANAALMHQFCGEIPRTQERAEATITFATEHGFPHWVNWGTAFRGWALAAQGQGEVGISLLRQSLATLTASRVRLARPHLLTLLVDACRRMGQTKDGLNAVAEALAQVQDTGERYCEAELYRLRGELTLAQSRASLKQISNKSKASQNKSRVSNPQSATHNPQLAEAEACFLKAIEIARTQQAKSLELRAVMSLVRLRQYEAAQAASRITQHETRAMLNKAHAMLSDIYNWFTEGFETKDLQEAKVLLDALRA